MKKRIRSFLFFISCLAVFVSFLQYLNVALPELMSQLHSSVPKDITNTVSVTPAVLGDSSNDVEIAVVKKVIDGDTIELENGQTVRYIGIDTPESKKPNTSVQCFSLMAASRNRELVEGKVVQLVKDVSTVDRYGRLLRYVYVEGLFINDLLVKEGYAFARSYPPDISKQDQLRQSELQARETNTGLWGSCIVNKNGKKEEWIIK